MLTPAQGHKEDPPFREVRFTVSDIWPNIHWHAEQQQGMTHNATKKSVQISYNQMDGKIANAGVKTAIIFTFYTLEKLEERLNTRY